MDSSEQERRQAQYDELNEEPEELEDENAAQNVEELAGEDEENQEDQPVRAINDSVAEDSRDELVQDDLKEVLIDENNWYFVFCLILYSL